MIWRPGSVWRGRRRTGTEGVLPDSGVHPNARGVASVVRAEITLDARLV
jgi:hypothetical protein